MGPGCLQAMKGSMDELRNHVSELDTKADGLANRVEALEKHSKVVPAQAPLTLL